MLIGQKAFKFLNTILHILINNARTDWSTKNLMPDTLLEVLTLLFTKSADNFEIVHETCIIFSRQHVNINVLSSVDST